MGTTQIWDVANADLFSRLLLLFQEAGGPILAWVLEITERSWEFAEQVFQGQSNHTIITVDVRLIDNKLELANRSR